MAFSGKILYPAKKNQRERHEAHGKDIMVAGPCPKKSISSSEQLLRVWSSLTNLIRPGKMSRSDRTYRSIFQRSVVARAIDRREQQFPRSPGSASNCRIAPNPKYGSEPDKYRHFLQAAGSSLPINVSFRYCFNRGIASDSWQQLPLLPDRSRVQLFLSFRFDKKGRRPYSI
jgi:hypothetical protein